MPLIGSTADWVLGRETLLLRIITRIHDIVSGLEDSITRESPAGTTGPLIMYWTCCIGPVYILSYKWGIK